MNNQVIAFNTTQVKADQPDFRAGDVVRVHRKIKEGEKERIQIFEGMIIAIKGGQSSSPMITVRKVSNGIGVEIVVPVYSPTIEKVEHIKRAKVRRAKLYYIRDKAAKALRFKFKDMSGTTAGSQDSSETKEQEATLTDTPANSKEELTESPEKEKSPKEETKA